MNPFAEMLNDTVFIENKAGEKAGPFKTAVANHKGKLKADIFEESLNVEDGDKLIRPLPNGKEEVYTIIDAHFQPGLHGIPAFWDLTLAKGTSGSTTTPTSKTTIHISHSQGIQIGDHNVQHIANGLQGLIEKIDASTASAPDKAKARNLILKVLENPTVAAILGAATGGLIGLVKS